MPIRIRTMSLITMAALFSIGARCSESETSDGGPTPDRVECVIDGSACLPAFAGAACGPTFTGWYIDGTRRCIDRTRSVTIGCFVPPGGGATQLTCYQYDGPSGSGVAWMPSIPGLLARTTTILTRCPDALASDVALYPSCD